MKLNILPRVRLVNLPTPLQELPNLSKVLQGPRIFVKRDDLTGLGFGGNKSRKLEYLMADALNYKADYVVTGAGFQSNWCTQTAAAARKLGLKTVLVKTGPREGYDSEDYDGNHLLQFLIGAEIKVVGPQKGYFVEALDRIIKEETMEELKAAGHRPYHISAGGSNPPGVSAYVNAMLELAHQSVELGIKVNYLVHASGSGGTQAGLIIGAKAFSTGIKIIGSTTGSRTKNQQIENVSQIVEQTLRFLQLDLKITEEDILVYDQYAGSSYGLMTQQKAEAVKVMAETEGLFLDPVYTSSAMACLIDLCRQGFFKRDDVVVFLHTGGTAALFPYKVPLKAYGLKKTPAWTIPPWSYSH